jgi:carbon monoxide dehydrogenase subunit G
VVGCAVLAATRAWGEDGVMDLTHHFSVPAPVEEAWKAFNDLERLAPCFPGATINSVDGDEFAGSVKVKLGPISMMYNGSGRYLERNVVDRRVVIEARGKDKRGNGTATATVTASFSESGERTDVEVLTDLVITGKPAQFGSEVISDVSDKLLDQFASCFSGRFAGGLGTDDLDAAETDSSASAVEAASADAQRDEADTEQTIELEAVPAEDGPADEVPADEMAATASAAVQANTPAESPSAPQEPASPAYAAQRQGDTGESTLSVLSTVVPVLLKRYGPALAVFGMLLFIVIKIIRRKS